MEEIRQGDIPGVQLRRRVEIANCSPERVWPNWVETRRLERWLCDRASSEGDAPVVFRFETDGSDGRLRREYAEVVERAQPHRLVLGFRQLDSGWEAATMLTVELVAAGEACRLSVLQEGFQKLPLSIGLTAWEEARARWTRALARLAELATSHGPG